MIDRHLTKTFDWKQWLALPENRQKKVMPEGIIRNVPYFLWIELPGASKPFLLQTDDTKSYKGYICNAGTSTKENCRFVKRSMQVSKELCYRDLSNQNDSCIGCTKVEYARLNYLIAMFKDNFDLATYMNFSPSLRVKFRPYREVLKELGLMTGNGVTLR